MKKLILLSLIFISCGIFQPSKFDKSSLEENILSVERDSLKFSEIINSKNQNKTLIHIYASYCPFSQKSLEEIGEFQKENKNIKYVFLSVDHSYFDWKRGVEDLPVKGEHYYLPRKGKGFLGRFLKLKEIPRFLVLNKEGEIKVFKSSKVSKIKESL